MKLAISIISVQVVVDFHAHGLGSDQGAGGNVGAGVVLYAIYAVSVCGQSVNIGLALQRKGQAQTKRSGAPTATLRGAGGLGHFNMVTGEDR